MTGRVILSVDDNDLNQKIIRDLFTSRGYRVIEAVDGAQAVSLAERERPDIILMDLQLPEVSGFDAVRRIKANPGLRHIPVVAVTSYALKGDDQRAYEAGCDGYMTKPYGARDLVQTVERFLAAPPR